MGGMGDKGDLDGPEFLSEFNEKWSPLGCIGGVIDTSVVYVCI